MRVLLINQFFWPDLAATSQLLTDLAGHMASRGHDVTVICARHSYAGEDCTEQPPVRVVRVPDLAFTRGRLARPLSYLSFLAGSAIASLRIPKPDVVVTMTTPPLLSLVGYVVQKFRSARHYIWEMDLYPDAAVDLRVLRAESPATRAMASIADFARRRASGIIVLGECMRARVISHGILPDRVEIAENWADGALLRPSPRNSDGPLTLVYPGNLGLAHDTDTVAGAMQALRADPSVRFLFIGGGPRSEPLRRFCESNEIANASFLPYCSRDRLNDLMASSQIGLVTQTNACLGSLVPSKAYALMAAGLPIVFVGPAESTVASTIARFSCGWRIECGDSSSLVQLLKSLVADRAQVHEAGERARDAFMRFYDKPVGVSRVCKAMGLSQATGGA